MTVRPHQPVCPTCAGTGRLPQLDRIDVVLLDVHGSPIEATRQTIDHWERGTDLGPIHVGGLGTSTFTGAVLVGSRLVQADGTADDGIVTLTIPADRLWFR